MIPKLQILPLYIPLFALLFAALTIRTLRLRRALKIGVGDGGNPIMLRAMRVHGNFAEYVPICLLLLLAIELQGGSAALLHALCAALFIGRLSHAFGVSHLKEDYRFRVFGMVMTLATIILGSLYLLALYFRQVVA